MLFSKTLSTLLRVSNNVLHSIPLLNVPPTASSLMRLYSSGLQFIPPTLSSKVNISMIARSGYATMVDSEEFLKRKHILDSVNSEIETLPENKLFAVVHLAGRQHKVTINDLIVINRIPAELGSQIVLKKVLLVGSENFTLIGRPLLSEDDVNVVATVVEHTRLKKVVVFKKKRRKNYKRTQGHRQNVTVLRINQFDVKSNIE